MFSSTSFLPLFNNYSNLTLIVIIIKNHGLEQIFRLIIVFLASLFIDILKPI